MLAGSEALKCLVNTAGEDANLRHREGKHRVKGRAMTARIFDDDQGEVGFVVKPEASAKQRVLIGDPELSRRDSQV